MRVKLYNAVGYFTKSRKPFEKDSHAGNSCDVPDSITFSGTLAIFNYLETQQIIKLRSSERPLLN